MEIIRQIQLTGTNWNEQFGLCSLLEFNKRNLIEMAHKWNIMLKIELRIVVRIRVKKEIKVTSIEK